MKFNKGLFAFFSFIVVISTVTSIYQISYQRRFIDLANIETSPQTLNKYENVGLGLFHLANPKINCDATLAALNPLPVLNISWLYNTFGNNFSCLRKLMTDSRLVSLQTHLINEPGHRNSRLGSYEFLSGVGTIYQWQARLIKGDKVLKRKFFKYVKPLQKLLAENLGNQTECLINPGLESNITNKRAAKTLLSWTREAFPNCSIVWNPVSTAALSFTKIGADLYESHGVRPKVVKNKCIVNMDGTDINFPERYSRNARFHKLGQPKNWINAGRDLQAYMQNYSNICPLVFLWVTEFNCIDPNSDKFVDPRKRRCDYKPDVTPLVVREILNLLK